MSAADTSINQRKDRLYIKQTIAEQNSNNKKGLKEYRPSETSQCSIVQKYFLICQLCFWCASYYTYDTANESPNFEISNLIYNLAPVQRCPSCSKGTIESLPILYNEHNG
ncbi:MAG: hypothetical protein JO297_16320 [Nitrososphaeraceae archaeon]|nr:hypothetical protein [Nitrososphaeraceae archaeon]